MRQPVLYKLLLAGTVGLLFILIFSALQNERIWQQTLGKITHVYERNGSGRTTKILEVNKPYSEFNYESIRHWDGALYYRVRNEGYHAGAGTGRNVKEKLAFYPLFPFLWKVSCIDSVWIVYFNFAVFLLGLLLLSGLLMKNSRGNLFYFAAAILLPSTATYYLPYAESLFLLTMAIAVYGIFQRKYWIYAAGAFLFSMTRPAALIFMFALLSADLIYLLRHRSLRYFLKEFMLKILPCIAGFGVVTGVQYWSSGSWTAYFDSMELWPAESGFFNQVTDWSKEGFGMSVFAIFFLAIPALLSVVIWSVRSLMPGSRQEPISVFGGDEEVKRDYLFKVSLLFIAGNLVYTFLTSGNVINGFYRYTMSVPFFFLIFFQLPGKFAAMSFRSKILLYLSCLGALISFLGLVNYGTGTRFHYSNSGLFLSLALTLLLLFEESLPVWWKWILIGLLALPCIVWHTYLFNMFLGDVWIFT
jgi:hypothetical protein